MTMARTRFDGLLVASNRPPVVVSIDGGEVGLDPSSGGLVAALRATSARNLWVGWPGMVVPSELEGTRRRRAGR